MDTEKVQHLWGWIGGAEAVGWGGGRLVQNILSAVPGFFENRKPALKGAPSSTS